MWPWTDKGGRGPYLENRRAALYSDQAPAAALTERDPAVSWGLLPANTRIFGGSAVNLYISLGFPFTKAVNAYRCTGAT
jgi:hypothetical protein